MKALLILIAVLGMAAGIAVPYFGISGPLVLGFGVAVFTIGLTIQIIRSRATDKAIRTEISKRFEVRPSLTAREFATAYFLENERGIAEEVRCALETIMQYDVTRIMPSDRFIEDLHIDHFDDWGPVYILEEIEKRYQIKFEDIEAEKIKTVGEFVGAIKAKIA